MQNVAAKYPRFIKEIERITPNKDDKLFIYGTAGFRDKANKLDSLMHRMGMLAVLRSRCLCKIIGLMVTASHNPSDENGVKLIEPNGEMFIWEDYATQIANASNEELGDLLDDIIKKENIDLERSGNIFIARDTRESSEHLCELAREGALLLGGNVLDFSLQTTPQLHHLVRMWNYESYNRGDWASEAGYYNMLVDAFKQIIGSKIKDSTLSSRQQLVIDGAHGVGSIQISKLFKELEQDDGSLIPYEIRNTTDDGGILNYECGAEYVQKSRTPPKSGQFDQDKDRLKRLCSIDGDGDRVVYHYFDEFGTWKLLDGDKMAALFSSFLKDCLDCLGLGNEISLGVVQTSYANGSSNRYIKSLGLTVVTSKTGVKYCHKKASEFDIGLYFESNGHGTCLFQDETVEKLHNLENSSLDERKKLALARILGVYQIMNQAVGDVMSDILLTEAILICKGLSIRDWDRMYQELPSRQTKVSIGDRTLVKCNDEETAVISPETLSEAISGLVSKYDKGRAFARPSGTEDIVRIYAEASTQEEADELALSVAKAVHEHAKGIGEIPSSFIH